MTLEQDSIDDLIKALLPLVEAEGVELLGGFNTYANEAKFGRLCINEELQNLKPGSEILEIGAGMFLLACQLKREGFAVTALEPIGSGFAHFVRLQRIILTYAESQQILPVILSYSAEALQLREKFDFAYSLNVMEHVTDIKLVLQQVITALKANGIYRFVCPNYSFPFETHFSIPVLGNKNTTFFLLKNKIQNSAHVYDPQGVWDSLNWISVATVRKISAILGYAAVFNKNILFIYIDRALNEASFCDRHPVIRQLVTAIKTIRLLNIIKLIPIRFLPIMDCKIIKTGGNCD